MISALEKMIRNGYQKGYNESYALARIGFSEKEIDEITEKSDEWTKKNDATWYTKKVEKEDVVQTIIKLIKVGIITKLQAEKAYENKWGSLSA